MNRAIKNGASQLKSNWPIISFGFSLIVVVVVWGARMEAQVQANTDEIDRRAVPVESITEIKSDLSHIRGTVDQIRADVNVILCQAGEVTRCAPSISAIRLTEGQGPR